MIKVNTEQLIAAAEQMTLQVSRLQETEDRLQAIQAGLKEAGTEFEKHISAVDRQRRKVQEERLTLKRMVSILESAAEQYTECERKNLNREGAGKESDYGNTIDITKGKVLHIIIHNFRRSTGLVVIPGIPRPGSWKPKPVPRPQPKPEHGPGRDRRPGHRPGRGHDVKPRGWNPSRYLFYGGRKTTGLVAQAQLTAVYNTNIFDLVK